MPIYVWKDKNSGVHVEVVRDFKNWEEPPTEEECAAVGATDLKDTDWERVIGNTSVVRGHGWGSKGNWIQLAGIIGTYICQGFIV